MPRQLTDYYTAFRTGNLRLFNYFVAVKPQDPQTGQFSRIWLPLGFSGGDTTIAATLEEFNIRGFAGVQVDLDNLVKYLGYTITINLVEADIAKMAKLNFNQNLYEWTQTTNSNKVYTFNSLSAYNNAFTTPPTYLPEPPTVKVMILDIIPVGTKNLNNNTMVPNTFQVQDNANTDLSSGYTVKFYRGVYYIVANTSLPNNVQFPITITISRRVEARAYETAILNNTAALASEYRLLVIGRNVAAGNSFLMSVYVPRAKLTKGIDPEFKTEDYNKPQITFKTLLRYPEGMYPTDANVPINYMEIWEWLEPDIDTNDILAFHNDDVVSDGMNQ